MARRIDITPRDARALLEQGLVLGEVAERLGVSVPTIRRRAREAGWRGDGSSRRILSARPEAGDLPPAPSAADPAEAALIATGGRYAALAAWAEDHGLTLVQAQARWHRLGLTVSRGARS